MAGGSSYESPFKSSRDHDTTKIPSFSNYKSRAAPDSNLVFQYFMVGSMGLLAAAGAKATIQGELSGCPLQTRRPDQYIVQTFSSTCPRPPMCWPRPRSRSIWLPFP